MCVSVCKREREGGRQARLTNYVRTLHDLFFSRAVQENRACLSCLVNFDFQQGQGPREGVVQREAHRGALVLVE